jgi:FlaA1/EpsC-like NDP-sugar epimerase
MKTMQRVQQKLGLDIILWVSAAVIAFFMRIDLPFLDLRLNIFWFVIVTAPIKIGLVILFQLHRQSWHRVGVRDLYQLAWAIGLYTVPVYLLNFTLVHLTHIPRSVPLIEGGVALLALGGVRLMTRVYFEREDARSFTGRSSSRVLIVGAGEAGIMIAREMLRHPSSGLEPVGFLDDEPAKANLRYMGLPVLGVIDALPRLAAKASADQILIALPSVAGRVIRRVVDLAQESNLKYRIIPGVFEILSGKVGISQIRDVDLEDLLRREPVKLHLEDISGYLEQRTVLITGAGGSIGSEIVRQVARFQPTRVVLFGRGENSVFLMAQELRRMWPELEYHNVIGDVRDKGKLEEVFLRFSPQVVFHAAAHKHVGLMEQNPDEAVFNNVKGTKNLVELSLEFRVERFVNISTDKAVNPTSVMGASKRIAEYVVEWGAAKALPGQVFVSVRFGNVLGSRGSVVPLFKEQIKAGGPVLVTHPDMTRYFMTIPEAAQLVLQAGGLGINGAVYVLDMGEPVKILDLAKDVIRLSGFEAGTDIDIVFTGAQPGEKLFEELLTHEEGTTSSKYAKIFSAKKAGMLESELELGLNELFHAAQLRDGDLIRETFKKLIPSFGVFAANRV